MSRGGCKSQCGYYSCEMALKWSQGCLMSILVFVGELFRGLSCGLSIKGEGGGAATHQTVFVRLPKSAKLICSKDWGLQISNDTPNFYTWIGGVGTVAFVASFLAKIGICPHLGTWLYIPRQHSRINICRYLGWVDNYSIYSPNPNNSSDSETRHMVTHTWILSKINWFWSFFCWNWNENIKIH